MSCVLEIRPTTITDSEAAPDDITTALLGHFAHKDGDIIIRSVGHHLVLTHVAHLRHAWSPWLHIEVEPRAAGSRVIAKFTPHPNLWTSFAFGYFTLGSVALFAACYAGAQMMLGQYAWAWWVALGAAVVMLMMFVFAKLGQKLAADQMRELTEKLVAVLSGFGPMDGALGEKSGDREVRASKPDEIRVRPGV